MLASQAIAFVIIIATVQFVFRDVDHFSLLHSGVHGYTVFGWPVTGTVGLLFGPEAGLLVFFPYLAWGLWAFRKGGDRYLPAIVFFLVHASYQHWAGGTGFSARYLVPMLPVMVLAVAETRPRGWLFKTAIAYSLCWGFLAGLLPAIVYDRTPWGVVEYLLSYGHRP